MGTPDKHWPQGLTESERTQVEYADFRNPRAAREITKTKKDNMNGQIIQDITEDGVRKISYMTSQFVCSRCINMAIKDNVIQKVIVIGGCSGNTQGVAALLKGMTVSEAINRLDGINCNGRGTSCPDQIARALKML